jgi:hypothetical protein
MSLEIQAKSDDGDQDSRNQWDAGRETRNQQLHLFGGLLPEADGSSAIRSGESGSRLLQISLANICVRDKEKVQDKVKSSSGIPIQK